MRSSHLGATRTETEANLLARVGTAKKLSDGSRHGLKMVAEAAEEIRQITERLPDMLQHTGEPALS